MRKSSIDCLRGALIFLVIAGHVLEIEQRQSVLGWIGAGFRMPVMIGLSGYLLNLERARTLPLGEFSSRFGRRLLLPWLFAILIYMAVGGAPFGWTTAFDVVLRAPYHLWYVPVLCALIMLARFVPLSPFRLLLLVAPASLTTMYLIGLGHAPLGEGLLAPDSRFLRFALYFCFGMMLARAPLPPTWRWAPLAIGALGTGWWILLFYHPDPIAGVIARLMMNLGLIACLPLVLHSSLSFAPLNTFGRNSLFYYLWHPLALGVALQLTTWAGTALLLTFGLLVGARIALSRWPLLAEISGVTDLRRLAARRHAADVTRQPAAGPACRQAA